MYFSKIPTLFPAKKPENIWKGILLVYCVKLLQEFIVKGEKKFSYAGIHDENTKRNHGEISREISEG